MLNDPIILGGCYRSGTSLLRRMMDAHSRIHCAPEVKFFEDFYGDYPTDELAHVRFFSTARSLGIPDGELLHIFGRAFIDCHERAARRRGKARWADKNPENVLFLEQWHALLKGRFFFVHVVRHPLDTLASLVEANFARAVPDEFTGKIEVYRRFVESGLAFASVHPQTSFLLHYEDLVSEPYRVLAALLDRIGECFEPSMVTEYNSDRQVGIEDPKVGRTTAVHRDSVGRWQRDLSIDQARLAALALHEVGSRLGYALAVP